MNKNRTQKSTVRRHGADHGFSMIELLVVLFIIIATSAIALPNFIKMFRASQLTNGATQVADILKQTRFQAIRRNTPVVCQIAGSAASTTIWADVDGNPTGAEIGRASCRERV